MPVLYIITIRYSMFLPTHIDRINMKSCILFSLQRYHSIILMAACDADYRFIFVDVGSPGADGDVNVFARTELGKNLLEESNNLNLPEDAMIIDEEETPFFFVADDAFPLSKRIMKPHGGTLTNEQKVFNYRLSRARRTIENAFGLLTMRWGCLRSEFLCHPDKAKLIAGACCALHNYMLERSPQYTNSVDRYDEHGNVIEGEWRSAQQPLDQINAQTRGQSSQIGNFIRERLTNFFYTTDILSYQFDRAHCT